MINFRFLLGFYKAAEKIEAQEAALIKEYEELSSYINSEELARYFELKKIVESEAFVQKKKDLAALDYKKTEAFAKETEFKNLEKSAQIKNYFKVLASPAYSNYTALKDAEKLGKYLKLKEVVKQPEFVNLKGNLKKLIFKGSEEFNKEKELAVQAKSKLVKNYYAVLQSEAYKNFTLVHDSEDLKQYEELKAKAAIDTEAANEFKTLSKDPRFVQYYKFLQSPAYALFVEANKNGVIEKYEKLKAEVESDTFKEKKAYLLLPFDKKWEKEAQSEQEKEYMQLASDSSIKDFEKFVASKEFTLFNEALNNGNVDKFQELKTFVDSEKFKTEKAYMLLKYEQKWKQTEECQQEEEYKKLAASEKIKWYLSVANSNKFDYLKAWKQTFADEFDTDTLDASKWLTRYFWADSMLKQPYAMFEDQYYPTDGKNLKIQQGILNVETKTEKIQGIGWNPALGFMPKEFDYTTGIINSGKSFRQKYGRFRAKIKLAEGSNVLSAFWMVGDQVLPHLDIAKNIHGKLSFGNIWMKDGSIDKSGESISGSRFAKAFHIYELEWTPENLIWRINDIEIFRTSSSHLSEPLYLQLGGGVMSKNSSSENGTMQVDWVRCYEKA
jgi:hypothetical protein